jgi:hypothetical protein
MLDHFLEVSYRADSEAKEKRAFIESLKGLPMEDLAKLASGETTLEKLAHGMCDENCQWLERYKDTPLFEQALALEQAELQNQMARQQNEIQQDSTPFYREGDKIRLQKRMLDLQLVQGQAQAAAGAPPPPAPEAPAQGAGAPGAGAPNNEEAMGAASEQAKMGSAPLWKKLGGVLLPTVIGGSAGAYGKGGDADLGRGAAGAGGVLLGSAVGSAAGRGLGHLAGLPGAGTIGDLVGGAVGGLAGYRGAVRLHDKHKKKDKKEKHKKKTSAVKEAVNFGAMGSAIKQNLGRVAKVMPQGALVHAGIGAGVGAVGGAIAGGPDNRLGGALGGAALGGVGGLAGSNIARAAQAGGGLTGRTAMNGLWDTGLQLKATGNAVAGGVKKGLRAGEAGVAGAAKVAPSGIPMGDPGSPGTIAAIPVPHTPTTDAIPLQLSAYNPQ